MNKDKRNILDQFLDYKKTSVNYEKKLKLYDYFVGMFIESANKKLDDFAEQDLINFVNQASKKYSVGSMNEVKIMLKSFITWHFEDFPKRFKNLKRICKGQRKEKTYKPEQMLSKEDFEKLVKEEHDPKWKAFLLLFFYGGFRPIEICRLTHQDIIYDKEVCYVTIFCKKNKKRFEKFIPDNVVFYLKKLENNRSKWLFPSRRQHKKGIPQGDVPMTTSGIWQHIVPLAKRVLNKHINPYIIRHSIATILYNKDNLKDTDVAMQLGHSTAMKETYNNLSIDKIRERMKKIYIETEDLPKEKKEDYEKRIKALEEFMNIVTDPKNDMIDMTELASKVKKNVL